ncbi:MAG TPA: helix-turn-helix domain-containing protein [Pseudonocardiaceae bacterium]|jgi:transcriptional regulator with XRE-family HTH domain|nr:helix-turn-helix domain-containing protein [Pseudonocardiaceae bacterium]
MANEDSKAFGRRVAFYRKKLGYSQRQLAAVINRSETWVSQVERGVRKIDRMSVLQRLAGALAVPVAELAPEQSVVATTSETPPAVTTLSRTLAASDALRAVLSEAGPVDLAGLAAQSARAWDYAHGSRDDELADLLATLLPELEQAEQHSGADQRRQASVAKAQAYHAAAAVLAKLGETAAAWVAVDRAIHAAQQAGDPLLMAEGAFRLASVFQAARRFDLAMRAASSAAEAIAGLVEQGDQAAVAMHGALHLQLALAAAQSTDADGAYGHLETARRAAAQLGADRNDYHTEFGPTNVLLHEVAVAVELGDAGRAVRVAAGVDAVWLSPERQARLLIDVASAHAQLRHPEAVVSSLREALRIAPEQIETHDRVRTLVADLLRGDRRTSSEVQELAARLKVEP